MKILTGANFLLYASANYDNPNCQSTEEFQEDLRRIKYVKKLITRAAEGGELKTRLILNHLIVLNNVFAPMVLCRMLYLKMPQYMPYLKPFLLVLNVYQPRLYNINKEGPISLENIAMNDQVIEDLRQFSRNTG